MKQKLLMVIKILFQESHRSFQNIIGLRRKLKMEKVLILLQLQYLGIERLNKSVPLNLYVVCTYLKHNKNEILFFSNSEITSNLIKSDEIVISDGEDSELQNNEPEVLIVNERSDTVVNFESIEKSPEPLIDHVTDNDSNEVLIMEEEMAVDLSITSKNNNSEGKYFFYS